MQVFFHRPLVVPTRTEVLMASSPLLRLIILIVAACVRMSVCMHVFFVFLFFFFLKKIARATRKGLKEASLQDGHRACLKVSGYKVIGRARGDLGAKFAANVQV